MSKSTRSKNLKKNCAPSENLVSSFIDKPEESEAAPRKKRKVEENVLDDSLKFFKAPKLRSTKASEASSSNAATNFINESSKKSAVVKPKAKAAAKTSKKKPKAQPDIRKVLTRQDQLCNQAVNESCLREGLDPDEMQLALAISESLKDQNKSESSASSSKFDNPFASMGKVQPVGAILERFGFKSKTNFSEYELDLLANTKVSKRSKFMKFPTILTRTSSEDRTRLIQEKIDAVLDDGNQSCLTDFKDSDSFAFIVSSFYLQEMHENARTTFAISSEDRPVDEILLNYYVSELFEPSFTKTGHLLKDWRAIPGRDPTPERKIEEMSQENDDLGSWSANEAQEEVERSFLSENTAEKEEKELLKPGEPLKSEDFKSPAAIKPTALEPSLSNSCEDIFAGLEDCEINENYFSQAVGQQPEEEEEEEEEEEKQGKEEELKRLEEKQKKSQVEQQKHPEDEHLKESAIDELSEKSASDLIEHLDSLHVKLSQSMVLEVESKAESPVKEFSSCDHQEEKQKIEETKKDEENLVVEIEDDEMIDLTLRETTENEVSIPYDDSYYSLQQHLLKTRRSRPSMSPPVSLSPENEVLPVESTAVVEIGSDSTIELDQTELEAFEEDREVEAFEKVQEVKVQAPEKPPEAQTPEKFPESELKANPPVASQNSFIKPATPEQIDLLSSEEETDSENLFLNLQSFDTTAVEDEADLALSQNSTQNSLTDDDEVIAISDEEINYSMRRFHNRSEVLEEEEEEEDSKGEEKLQREEENLQQEDKNLQQEEENLSQEEENLSPEEEKLSEEEENVCQVENLEQEESSNSRKLHQNDDFCQEFLNESKEEEDPIDLTQADDDFQQFSQVEINNLVEQSLIDVMGPQDEVFNINDTVSSLLETSVVTSNLNLTRSNESMKFMQNEGLSDSLREIMARYGVNMEAKESPRSFRKMQSDSNLVVESNKNRKSFQIEVEDEAIVDLTQPLDEEEAKENSFNNLSIHQSLQNILSNTPIRPRAQIQLQKPARKSLGVQIDDNYKVDTETAVAEPEFSSMTPVELKQALFKYGIRPLPVKKAVTLLQFIFDQLNPKISVAADEEMDANDTRRALNITDIVTDIGMKEDDEFVFQPGLVEDEEVVLPKSRKSKKPSCAIPLHISFYNMVRSNEKLQKFILEFRPIELDVVCKHFKKFGVSYENNDIIAFLDRRCITFKTKEKSYSKTHEAKKQKRAKKSQKK